MLGELLKNIEVFDILWNVPRLMTVTDAIKLAEDKARDGFWVIIDGQMYNDRNEIPKVIQKASKIAFMVPIGGG